MIGLGWAAVGRSGCRFSVGVNRIWQHGFFRNHKPLRFLRMSEFVSRPRFTHHYLMPIALLRELTHRRLPCWIDDPVALDKLRLLRAAELIAMMVASAPEAAVPGTPRLRGHVLAITQKGRLVSAARDWICLDAVLAQQPLRVHEQPVSTSGSESGE